MKKLSRRDCNYWGKKIGLVKTAINQFFKEGVESIEELNHSIGKLNEETYQDINKGILTELIERDNKYSQALLDHPLMEKMREGMLKVNGKKNLYYCVKINVGSIWDGKDDRDLWIPTSMNSIEEIITQMGINKNSYLGDIGGGDARIGYVSPCRTDCIEKNSKLIKVAEDWRKSFGENNMQLIENDFYKQDLSKYTHLFISLSKHPVMDLSAKLFRDVSKDTKILTVLNPLDTDYFEIEKVIPFLLNITTFAPIAQGFIQRKR